MPTAMPSITRPFTASASPSGTGSATSSSAATASTAARTARSQSSRRNAVQNLADNDREGIDLQIIYPTGGLFLSRVREPDYAVALCQTYNDWLYDWCSADKKRLKGVALVPLHVDVRAAVDEAERAMSRLGTVGVMVNTYDRSRKVAHRDFWPFYQECARQGGPVPVHPSGTDTLRPLGHADNVLRTHTCAQPHD